jgi:hypothetical protein
VPVRTIVASSELAILIGPNFKFFKGSLTGGFNLNITATVNRTIKTLNIEHIYYKKMGIIPASLAVSNSPEGLMLKTQLDSLLSSVENEKFFSDFINYTSMNDSGEVFID